MDERLFREFTASGDTLRVYNGSKRLFSSKKARLLPLLDYIERFPSPEKGVTVLDRITGNAAALLLKKIGCAEIYSLLGSELAIGTLNEAGIKYHFTRVAPYIQNRSQQDMCPMEKLSRGKSVEEFYQACLAFYARP